MKVKKLLCLGMAALLMCSNLPQMEIYAQSDTQAEDYMEQNTEYTAETNEIVSGKCGENVYYEFNPSTETMRIYGEGAMDDFELYNKENPHPWFRKKYALNIKKVKIEEGVTYIGEYAFYALFDRSNLSAGCGNLDSVEISDTVTNIGDCAFRYCPIETIKFPNNLKTIGEFAFQRTGIKELYFPYQLESIGKGAFQDCHDLTKIDFSSQIRSIGDWCFIYCTKLKQVKIPDNCDIGVQAFGGCGELEHAIIGANCIISSSAFEDCGSLISVFIGEESVDNGYGIFWGCTNLQSIFLPDSWESFRNFSSCVNLTDIRISDTSLKYKIVDKVLYSKDGSKLIYYPTDLPATEYDIPENVTCIGEYAFREQEYLEHVIIPDSVREIGEYAFVSCNKLNYVIVPEGVQELGEGVFNCYSLKTIVLPASLKSVASSAKHTCTFSYTSLETIYAQEGTYAQEYAGEKFKQTIFCNFDADGGTVTPQKRPVICNDKYHKLPVPVREGYKFLGWYTESGNQVTDKTIVSSENSHTLYAHWEIGSKKQISDCEITLSSVNYIYDGNEKKPTVIVKDGLTTLTSGTDYSLTYSNNTNAGTATVTITGVGNYTGIISKNFTISAKPINEATVTLEKTIYTYDGTAKQPSVTVKDGSTTLRNETDYTVLYSNNVNVGTATVTVTGKGNYSGTTTKTFTINAQANNEKSFEWGKSNWKFDNNSRYFSSYDVNSDVMNKMKEDFNLSNSDIVELKRTISNDNELGFRGSCYGMTISEILAYQGDLKLSRYGGSDIVNQNTNTSNMISVINFIQELQLNSEMCQSIRQTPFLVGEYPQEEFILKLSDVVANANYLVKLSYKIVTRNTNSGTESSGAHAVLVYGIEKCNYYSTVTGKTYDRKVLIADPNYLSGNIIKNDACLYFKSSDSSWIVPYWNKTYSNGSVQSCYWNAESGTSTGNGCIRNIMQYKSLKEEVDLMAEFNAGHYIAGLEIDNKSQNVSSVEKVTNSGNSNIDYAGNFSGEIVRYDMDMDDNIYLTENDELYALWNPTSFYTLSYLKPSDYNLKMDYETIDYYADVTNSTYTLFKPSGSITLKGSDASYDITMVTDDSDCVTDWYSVTISGTDVDNLVYTKVENGYTLSASNLKNVKIFAEGEDFIADTTFNTNYNNVFIYEIDKNTIGVAVDTDNNGSYETTINTTDALKPIEKPNDNVTSKPNDDSNTVKTPSKGALLNDNKNNISYKVIEQGKTVVFYKLNNKDTTKLVIPDMVTINGITYTVTAISDNAFNGCKKLKYLTIGKNITTIGNNAFFKCTSLKNITIPANVIKIGKKAFYGCKKLKSVTIKSKRLTNKSVGTQAFKNIYKKAIIKVPKKQRIAYQKWLKKKGITQIMKIK